LGYVEGQNVTIEFRSAEGSLERLPDLVAELVQIPVDVIQTATSPTIRAAQQVTRSIPIVMGNSQDPVSEGFVASSARPGGNITGLTLFSPDLASKRLQFRGNERPIGVGNPGIRREVGFGRKNFKNLLPVYRKAGAVNADPDLGRVIETRFVEQALKEFK
jgi:ABC transporter substrate binding protein